MSYIPVEIIKKKRAGEMSLSREELEFFISGYVEGSIPDYQVAAWLMAVYFQGMTNDETALLTHIMRDSGTVLDFSHLKEKKIDKHSTGGVGDKTSMILAPIAAAAGVRVPMIAGRGLGHTGGTLDKLESLPGFKTNLSQTQFSTQVESLNLAIMGQTKDICPADKRLYALRDVTGTVDSIPLICASIMSKKLAEGIDGLVLDVKFGSGAFMKNLEQAESLAKQLASIGEHSGIKVHALLTNMEQPLGAFVGNALEMFECLEILEGRSPEENRERFYAATRDLSLELAAHMIWLAGVASDLTAARDLAQETLNSGSAFEKFKELCQHQGPGDWTKLPLIEPCHTVVSGEAGYLCSMDCEKIGMSSLLLGAGRKKSSDAIDYSAGLEILVQLGDKIEVGQELFRLYTNNKDVVSDAEALILKSLRVSDESPALQPLITKTIA